MMKFSRSSEIKIEEIAEKYNLPIEVVKKIVSSPYEFIRIKTRELEFKDNMTKEEFDSMKTNFNIPCLFKMHASYYAYSEIQKKKSKHKNHK